MDRDLDQLLATLKAQAPDTRLTAIEPQVWQRIAAHTGTAGVPAQLQWRAAAVGLSLSLGTVLGGTAASASREPAEMAVFSAHASLAPSTLLEGYP